MTMKRQRAHITPEGIALIIDRAVAYPRLKRTDVAEKLQKEFRSKGWNIPKIEVLERKISEYRNKWEAGPEDKPWNLDTLKDKPISPEASRKIFQVWLLKQEISWSPPLSIREAKWVARLSAMTENMERLRIVAELCAEWELIGELTQMPQLSSPATMLLIYETITGEGIEKERKQRILKEKQVMGKPSERIKEGLELIYGKGIIPALKEVREGHKTLEETAIELREKEAQNERTHPSEE